MRVIIAGSRIFIPTHDDVLELDKFKNIITEVVSGCAKGGDAFGESWALWNNIPIKKFPADWESFGKSAGIKRNRQMAEYADGLIAFIKNNSAGTRNMIEQAEIYNLWIKVIKK